MLVPGPGDNTGLEDIPFLSDDKLRQLMSIESEVQMLQRDIHTLDDRGRHTDKSPKSVKTPPRPAVPRSSSRPSSRSHSASIAEATPIVPRVIRGNIAGELLPVRTITVDSNDVGRLPAYSGLEVAADAHLMPVSGTMDISSDNIASHLVMHARRVSGEPCVPCLTRRDVPADPLSLPQDDRPEGGPMKRNSGSIRRRSSLDPYGSSTSISEKVEDDVSVRSGFSSMADVTSPGLDTVC